MIADRVGILNPGRLEQLGRPEEIYHRPATRFVARFVGKADFLPGRVTEEGIETEIGLLPNTPGFPRGTLVEVMIRPDHIELIPDPMGNAMILSRQYRGPDIFVVVRLPSGLGITLASPPSIAATTEFVVPRSLPICFAMLPILLILCGMLQCWQQLQQLPGVWVLSGIAAFSHMLIYDLNE